MALRTSRVFAAPSLLFQTAMAMLVGSSCLMGSFEGGGLPMVSSGPGGGVVGPSPGPPPSSPAYPGNPGYPAPGGAVDAAGAVNPPPSAEGGGAEPCAMRTVPAAIQGTLATRCLLCHGNPPLPAVPVSLATYDDLARRSRSDPTRTVAEMAVARIRNQAMPMPPAPGSPVPEAETQAIERWIAAGMPPESCTPGAGPAAQPDAGPIGPPVDSGAPPSALTMCTSQRYYFSGTGPRMRPGDNCLGCHNFTAAGTVYTAPHEVRWCNGVDGEGAAQGATVVVVDATGRTASARVNRYGNFIIESRLTPPLRAKVVFGGRERLMIGMVPHGACNRCHTQEGTTTVVGGPSAPGRIMLP